MKQEYTQIIERGFILDELEFERALIMERKLRLLISENPIYRDIRKELRVIIKNYEKKNWSNDSVITEEKIRESDYAEFVAEREREFLAKRKEIIKKKLAENNLNQQDLGKILKHGKSYISELINGVNSLSKKDLIILHKLLDIKIEDLIPTVIPQEEIQRIENTILKLGRKDLISRLYGSENSKKAKF